MEPLLRGYPNERPPPLERTLDNVNHYINVLISNEKPPLLKGYFSDAKGVYVYNVCVGVCGCGYCNIEFSISSYFDHIW